MERDGAAEDRLTGAERKRLKDKNRKRHGKKQKKRLHVLNNPNKLAFRGWEVEPEPWKYSTCEEYLEWCHISKLFPLERHRHHRASDKANLWHCLHADFVERCIQVYQFLYGKKTVERNEAPLFICRMVYAEVILHKVVDWRTIKASPSITMPTGRDIPKERRFREGGLGRKVNQKPNEAEYHTDDSDPDSDSDGAREGRPRPRLAAHHAGMEVEHVPQFRAHEHVDLNVDPAENSEGVQAVMEAIMDDVHGQVEGEPVVEQMVEGVPVVADVVAGVPMNVQNNLAQEVEELRGQVARKDEVISELQDLIVNLTREVGVKDSRISSLLQELQQRKEGQQPTVDDAMQVDEAMLTNVIDLATCGVIEDVEAPPKRLRPTVPLPPMGPHPWTYVDTPGPSSQDSLSFPPSSATIEETALRKANDELRRRLSRVAESYYQWKVAAILTVDRAHQMAKEFKKIDNEYLVNNSRRDFGLTSWPSLEEMFPEMPMQESNPNLIDWAKLDFDHANATSCHDLRMVPGVVSRKLWPNPAPWVVDGTECGVCLTAFGPEGAWAVGSCQHKFHPMCLIKYFLVKRFCPFCKAPFHERLYKTFGLTAYMPTSHEKNPENTPGETYRNHWGEDLIWSWRAQTHSVFKNDIGASFGWEHNHEEIVNVANHIVGSAPKDQGKRNFFYQVMNGFWDAKNERFQFGHHPDGLMWDRQGNLIEDDPRHLDINSRNAVQMDSSEWKEVFRSEAVDYLLEKHSPSTLRALEEMRNSQILRALTEVDGPYRRTRAQRQILRNDGAGPSNTAGED